MSEAIKVIRHRPEDILGQTAESVLNSIPLGIVAVDTGQIVRAFNHAAGDLLGIIPLQAAGSTLTELLDPEPARALQRLVQRTLESFEPQSLKLMPSSTKALEAPLRISTSVWRDSEHRVRGALLLCTAALAETSVTLTKVQELKNQFLCSISDELLTPLTAVRSFAEILAQDDIQDPDTRREYLATIVRESGHLSRRIHNLLELSKIETGMVDWKLAILPASEPITVAIDSFKSSAREKNLSIDYTQPDTEPCLVADLDKLVQVLITLLDRAARLAPPGGTLRLAQDVLKGKRQRDTADFVRIGLHLPEAHISTEKIESWFNGFTVGEDAGDHLSENDDLELQIAREIVKRLGGNMWTRSHHGGLTFYFTIPILRDVDAARHRASQQDLQISCADHLENLNRQHPASIGHKTSQEGE